MQGQQKARSVTVCGPWACLSCYPPPKLTTARAHPNITRRQSPYRCPRAISPACASLGKQVCPPDDLALRIFRRCQLRLRIFRRRTARQPISGIVNESAMRACPRWFTQRVMIAFRAQGSACSRSARATVYICELGSCENPSRIREVHLCRQPR